MPSAHTFVADIAISRSDFPLHPRVIDSTLHSALFLGVHLEARPSQQVWAFARLAARPSRCGPPTAYTATSTTLAISSFQSAASRLPVAQTGNAGHHSWCSSLLTGNPSGHFLGYFGNPPATTALQPSWFKPPPLTSMSGASSAGPPTDLAPKHPEVLPLQSDQVTPLLQTLGGSPPHPEEEPSPCHGPQGRPPGPQHCAHLLSDHPPSLIAPTTGSLPVAGDLGCGSSADLSACPHSLQVFSVESGWSSCFKAASHSPEPLHSFSFFGSYHHGHLLYVTFPAGLPPPSPCPPHPPASVGGTLPVSSVQYLLPLHLTPRRNSVFSKWITHLVHFNGWRKGTRY